MSEISKTSAANQQGLAVQNRQNAASVNGDLSKANTAGGLRQQLNVQILEVSVKTSIQSGNESQTLLFNAAIAHINEQLAPELGADAIQGKAATEDSSPEATAQRILSLSTGFYDAYAAQHPDTPPAQAAQDFVDLIRSGFEQGFKEATDILDGLKVFDGDIKDGIMKTYALVSQGYDNFLAGKLDAAGGNSTEQTSAADASPKAT